MAMYGDRHHQAPASYVLATESRVVSAVRAVSLSSSDGSSALLESASPFIPVMGSDVASSPDGDSTSRSSGALKYMPEMRCAPVMTAEGNEWLLWVLFSAQRLLHTCWCFSTVKVGIMW